MTLKTFLALLGDPLDGPTSDSHYEDIFTVLAHRPSPKNLGFIDSTSSTLSVTVNGHELAINQSPQLLKSQRAEGTTGAVVWSLTPLLASFLGSPTNPLAIHGILNPQATVLELGSGVSSILGLTLAFSQPSLRPARVVLSDQEYALRIARQNLEDNLHEAGHWEKLKEDVRPTYISYRVTGSSAKKNSGRETRHLEKPQTKSSMKVSPFSKTPSPSAPAILKTEPAIPLIVDLISLDWEQDSLRHHPAFRDHTRAKISLVIAIDCVYNESLVPHLIETCVDACSLPCPAAPKNVHAFESRGASETLVLIALELRSPDVLECFLEQFTKYFIVWRVPDSLLIQELRTGVDDECEGLGSGYVVYCGTLKGDVCVS